MYTYTTKQAVASRLQSLGALTRGDRRAAGTGGTTIQSFAIEGKYGKRAVDELIHLVFKGTLADGENAPEIVLEKFSGDDGLAKFCAEARVALEAMTVGIADHKNVVAGSDRLRRFMNRLLGVQIDLQDDIFDCFSRLMEHFISEDKNLGKYQEGISDVAGSNKKVAAREKLYECPRSGAVTEHVLLTSDRGVSWEEARTLLKEQKSYSVENELIGDLSGFYESDGVKDDFKYVLVICRKQPSGIKRSPYYIYVRPNTGNSRTEYNRSDVSRMKLVHNPGETLQKWWDKIYTFYYEKCAHIKYSGRCHFASSCEYGKRTKKIHLITGLCLPFWKELSKFVGSNNQRQCKVVRVQPDDDSARLVGIHVHQDHLQEIKAIIKRGTRSDVGIEDRGKRMVDR